jgi:energy-coupling factor transporter ATP-binding protein EcfA2
MPRIDTVVSCPVRPSFRVSQVQGMFDLKPQDTAEERFSAELPEDNEPWRIGLIVGPSGSGKTTVARAAFGRLDGIRRWPRDRAIVDCLGAPACGSRSIKEITAMLTAVGFSSPPAWIKPYHVLSQGERFRCDLARALLSGKRRVVFDEFTSVVDRTVARIGSAAVAKAVRRMADRQFVAVTCHYDVADWLEPDWVLDMGEMYPAHSVCGWPAAHGVCRIQWRRLRRPPLQLRLHRATADVWPVFARHHYLSAALNRSAHCYVGLLCIHHAPRDVERREPCDRIVLQQDTEHHAERDEYVPVAFAAVLNAIGRRGVWRVSRLVVLPDYQGIGVGRAMLAALADLYPRLRITTGHPAMLRALSADPHWQLAALRRAGYTRQPHAVQHARFHGGAIAATSAGRCVATFECKNGEGKEDVGKEDEEQQ